MAAGRHPAAGVSVRLTLPVLRRLMQDAPWARERLRPFAGHEVRWSIAGLTGELCIDEHGLPVPVAAADPAADGHHSAAGPQAGGAAVPKRPGVRLMLDSADVSAIAQGFDGLMRKVSLEGNAALAAELAFIARNLRPDPEEWLAPYLGDALAERAGQGLRASLAWSAQAGQRLASAGGEYLVHEARLLPAPEAVDSHCAAVDAMREGADRLTQRVARLERLLAQQGQRSS